MGKHRFYRDRFVQSDVWKVQHDKAVHVRAGHPTEEDRSAEDGQRFCTLTIECTIERKCAPDPAPAQLGPAYAAGGTK